MKRRHRIFPFIIGAGILAALLLVLNTLFPGALSEEASQIQLISLVLVATYLGLGVFSKQYKKTEVTNAVIGWSGIALILLLGYSFRFEAVGLFQRLRAELLPQYAITTGVNAVTLKKSKDGHFRVYAKVNYKKILFLVDTGASSIVLSRQDAEIIGLNPATLKYTIPTQTANGTSWSAPIVLEHIQIGPIVLKNVRASVAAGEMTTSLLGMTFLNALKSYEVTEDTLIFKGQ